MILCDNEIRAATEVGQLIIELMPPDDNITTSAIDLTLGGAEFKRWNRPLAGVESVLDPATPDLAELPETYLTTVAPDSEGRVLLPPGELVLSQTREWIELPNRFAAGRARGGAQLACGMGLGIHVTAPTIHSGFRGRITLELTNHGTFPIRVTPGMRICQLIVEGLFGTPRRALLGRFQDQTSVVGKSRKGK